jgi:hypothetical protein
MPFSPCAYPIRGAQIRNVRRTSLLPLLSLHGAVPYSYSRESVQSTLDCRTQNAPPPLTPETAILLPRYCYGDITNAMAAREALAARFDHKTLLIACEQVTCRQTLGGAAQFLRAQMSQEFGCFRPVPHLVLVLTVPRAQKKKTKRAAGSPAASTQLALCLRLAIDL